MNITKHYPMIMKALYSSPWLITSTAHEALVKGFEAHLKSGQVEIPDEDIEELLSENDTKEIGPKIAIVSIDGVIGKHLGMLEQCMGGCDIDNVAQSLTEAVTDPDVESVVMTFNTPGGTVTGVREFGELIAELGKVKKIVGYTDTMCASAGYWLASQCSEFYCSPSADVGSIGVYSILLDESRRLEDEGIKVNAISAGKWKLAGASFKQLTDEERAMFQADVDKIYANFKAAVSSNRTIADEDMQGQCFDGTDAVLKNLADGNINSLDELVSFLSELPR